MLERDIESRIDEYYKRTLRLNSLISADNDILSRIMSAVNREYNQEKLDGSVIFLHQGSSNSIYNIGSVTDPENQQEIPIAMRLMKGGPSFLNNDHARNQLEKELKEHEAAYALGENTPYFISVVTFPPYGEQSSGLSACAILTEDISRKHQLSLKEIDRSRVERTNEDGSKQSFFVDPHEFIELSESYDPKTMKTIERLCDGKKYLADNARIDLHL